MQRKYNWTPFIVNPDSDEKPECFTCDHFEGLTLAVGPSRSAQGPLGAFGKTPHGFKALVYLTESVRVVHAPGGRASHTLLLGEVHYTSTIKGAKSVAVQMGKMLSPVLRVLQRDRHAGKPTQRVPVTFGVRSGWLLYPASLIPEDEPEDRKPSLAESGTWDALGWGED